MIKKWKKTGLACPFLSSKELTDESDELETESAYVTAAPSSNKDFELTKHPILALIHHIYIPDSLWFSFSRYMPLLGEITALLSCTLQQWEPLWFLDATAQVTSCPPISSSLQTNVCTSLLYGAKSKGPQVATGCVNNEAPPSICNKNETFFIAAS